MRDRPVPRTKRNSNGWISDVTMRSLSLAKRTTSRSQTILIARSSPAKERAGTWTSIAGELAVVVIGSPSPSEDLGGVPQPVRRPGLGVADRGPGERHEHVVQGRPR